VSPTACANAVVLSVLYMGVNEIKDAAVLKVLADRAHPVFAFTGKTIAKDADVVDHGEARTPQRVPGHL
jgi:hypothetical protein